MADAGGAGSCELNVVGLSDRGKSSGVGAVPGEGDWTADLGRGLEVYEEDGSVAGEGRRRGEACEGGEEVGDAGVCTAACTSLASRCPVAEASVARQTSWRPHRESISPGALVSESLSSSSCVCVCRARVSACRLVNSQRRVLVRPQPVTRVRLEPPAAPTPACLKGRRASGEVSLCLSAGPTERSKAAAKSKRRWKEGVARNTSPLQVWD